MGDDGALYYMRQVDSSLWWAGLSADSPLGVSDFHLGLRFANVFRGRLVGSSIIGEWVDTPRGDVPQNGTMDLTVVSGDEIRRLRETGGFGGSVWRRTETPSRPDIASAFRRLFHPCDPTPPPPGPAYSGSLTAYQENTVVEGTVVQNLVTLSDPVAPQGGSSVSDQQVGFVMRADRILPVPEPLTAMLDKQNRMVVCRILVQGTRDGSDRAGESGPVLPGWRQRDANSVLFVNGRPVNGSVRVQQNGIVLMSGRDLPPGTPVQVRGFLALTDDGAPGPPKPASPSHGSRCVRCIRSTP